MRRLDKEIEIRSEIDKIIHGCQICHLGFAMDGEPYVVPVSFGYDGVALYFHTAREGRKIDFISSNPRVCLQFERDVNLERSEADACEFTFSFESVIGYGDVVEDLLARPVTIEPEEHDRVMATVSHVPQLLAVALFKAAMEDDTAHGMLELLAGKGFLGLVSFDVGEVLTGVNFFSECLLEVFLTSLIIMAQ